MATGGTIAYFLTLAFYGLLLGTTPLLFLSACFGHLNPKQFYGSTDSTEVLLMLAIIGDVSFILFTNILFLVSYDKLSQYLTQNNVLIFKVLVKICIEFVLTSVLGEENDLDTTKMAVICISLYAICSIKLVCGGVASSWISHALFKVFLSMTIEYALLNQNLKGLLSCGVVVLTAGIVEITPSLDPWNAAVTPEMARAHEVTFGNIRRAIHPLG